MDKKTGSALAQTAVAAALWGTSFPVITLGIDDGLNPVTFLLLRLALAVPIMILVSKLAGKNLLPLLRSKAVWLIGFANAVAFLCQFVGQKYTGASVAALLTNLSVVMAAAGGAVFLRERIGAVKAAGVGLAVLGTVLVTTNGSLKAVEGGQLLGDALYIAAAVAWGGYIVYAKKKTDEMQWDPFSLAVCIVMVTTVFVLPVALVSGGGLPTGSAPLLAVAYTAIFNTAIPYVLYQQGLRYLTAGTSAVVLMLEIVVALAVATAFLGESLTAFAWGGALLILVSIVMVSRAETSASPSAGGQAPSLTPARKLHGSPQTCESGGS